MHYAPCFVIPRGLSILYRCSLTTVAQDKPYHEKPLNRDCFNHKGSCTLFIPYLTIAAGISSSSFVWVSMRQLAVSFLSKGISSTLNFFMRALVLRGLKLATSRTQSKRRIDWANLADIFYKKHQIPVWGGVGVGPRGVNLGKRNKSYILYAIMYSWENVKNGPITQ